MNGRYLAAGLGLLLLLNGCDSSDTAVRTYRETYIAPPAPANPHAAHGGAMPAMMPPGGSDMASTPVPTAGQGIAWAVPAGWTEEKGGTMRLATLRADGLECAISAFPGDTGGLEPNLRRWLGQLNVTSPDPARLQELVQKAPQLPTAGGLTATVFDFAALLPADQPNSMLAAIIRAGDQTVFVKLMGERSRLQAQRADFESICRSIRTGGTP